MRVEKIIDLGPPNFIFNRSLDEGGGIYTFVPITLEIYNDKVKRHMLVPREFTDLEELLLAFEEARKNAW